MTLIFAGFIGFFGASLIAAYNMGWQAGHDLHHDDDMPKHTKKKNTNTPKRGLYV